MLRNVGDESTDQNNNITMTSEDLLQPGHVVKERWKVVSLYILAFSILFHPVFSMLFSKNLRILCAQASNMFLYTIHHLKEICIHTYMS